MTAGPGTPADLFSGAGIAQTRAFAGPTLAALDDATPFGFAFLGGVAVGGGGPMTMASVFR